MPSTRKQRAKERRSRQLDILSAVENVDIMLGSYSRDDDRNDQSEKELNLDSESSRPQQNSILTGDDFRSLLNTNRRENSEMTIETTRTIGDEIANQFSRKLNEIKSTINSQIQDAITTAIAEKVIPSIQNTLGMQGRANYTSVDRWSTGFQESPGATIYTMMDRRAGGLQRNPEIENTHQAEENRPKTGFTQENHSQMSRERRMSIGFLHSRTKSGLGDRSQPYPTYSS